MNYSLGNTLSRAKALNPDGLALDLAFALDKTLTSRKGPTPTFTRVQATSTGSTYIGADKLIKYAAANEPRFDYDPATGASKGLLIEESRTNLLLRSEEFGNVAWEKIESSVSENNTTSPSGEMVADKIVESLNNSGHSIRISQPLAASTVYATSVYVKASERSQLVVGLFSGTGWIGGVVRFDLITETSTVTGGSVVSHTIQSVGSGWYRCTVVGTTNSTTGSKGVDFSLASSNATTYLGDGTSGLYLWGAQLEAGAFATSYIPTTSGTAARSADVCGPMLLGESFINQAEGTLVIELTREPIGTTSAFRAPLRVWASDAINDYAGIDFNDSSIRSPLRTNNTTIYLNNVAAAGFGSRKIATSWQSGSSALVIDGVVRATNTSTFSFPTPLDTLGFAQITNAFYNGRIARIQYFRKRLSNAKLQTLTAP